MASPGRAILRASSAYAGSSSGLEFCGITPPIQPETLQMHSRPSRIYPPSGYTPQSHRSLTVVPLISYQRYDGETTVCVGRGYGTAPACYDAEMPKAEDVALSKRSKARAGSRLPMAGLGLWMQPTGCFCNHLGLRGLLWISRAWRFPELSARDGKRGQACGPSLITRRLRLAPAPADGQQHSVARSGLWRRALSPGFCGHRRSRA